MKFVLDAYLIFFFTESITDFYQIFVSSTSRMGPGFLCILKEIWVILKPPC